MSDVDDQGSLPSYVEREGGRSAGAKDLPPGAAADEHELLAEEERDRAHGAEDDSTPRTPFEPSTGEPDDAEGGSSDAGPRGGG